MNPYSYCPYCLQQATARTRGIPTYDRCAKGHQWLVSDGVVPQPEPVTVALTDCPFCQSDAVRVMAKAEDAGCLGPYQAWCCACGARGPKKHTEQAAAVAWGWAKEVKQ